MREEKIKKIATKLVEEKIKEKVEKFYKNGRKRKKPLTKEEVEKEVFSIKKDKKELKPSYKKEFTKMYEEVYKFLFENLVIVEGNNNVENGDENEIGFNLRAKDLLACSGYLKQNNFFKYLFTNTLFEIKKRDSKTLIEHFNKKEYVLIKPFENLLFDTGIRFDLPLKNYIKITYSEMISSYLIIRTPEKRFKDENIKILIYNSSPKSIKIRKDDIIARGIINFHTIINN